MPLRIFLIGYCTLYLLSAVLTMLAGGPFSIRDWIAVTAFGTSLILAGAYYRRWAPRWLQGH
jgi:hypothetical protein